MARKTATEQRLDDLCEKLDAWGERLEKAIEKHAAEDKDEFDKHDTRLGVLERSYAKITAVATIVSILFSAVAVAAAKHFLP